MVALVITIIVLLMLAGVTIVTLFGESGIITKAQKAADETNNGVTNDITDIENLGADIDMALIPSTSKGDMVPEETKYAKYKDNTSNSIVLIPGGYGVVQDSNVDEDNNRKINTIANGLVISDVEEDDLDNTKKGNQFVWVPVSDINSIYDEKHSAGKLYDFATYDSSTSKYIPLDNPIVRDYPGKNTGFREPDIVIGDGSDTDFGCDSSTKYYKDILGINSSEEFSKELQDSFDEMIESVRKYKGFYIGRYETGNLKADRENTPVVQKGKTDIGNINWYYMYQTSKKIAKNQNVVSSMIWGCQFDRTLQWLIETPDNDIEIEDVVDASKWGNYSAYNTATGDTTIKSGIKQPTGTKLQWQKNHIYDLAGNVHEWTLEAYDINVRTFRGGNTMDVLSTSSPTVFCRSVINVGYLKNGESNLGSRATLYIK